MRVLPWLAAQRRESPKAYDCETCQTAYDEDQRRSLRCGWVPRRRWRDEQTFRGVAGCIVGGVTGPELCPGYSSQLPRVVEVARLFSWERRRSIDVHTRTRGWELTETVMDLVDVFAAEQADSESYRLEQQKKRR